MQYLRKLGRESLQSTASRRTYGFMGNQILGKQEGLKTIFGLDLPLGKIDFFPSTTHSDKPTRCVPQRTYPIIRDPNKELGNVLEHGPLPLHELLTRGATHDTVLRTPPSTIFQERDFTSFNIRACGKADNNQLVTVNLDMLDVRLMRLSMVLGWRVIVRTRSHVRPCTLRQRGEFSTSSVIGM